MAAEEKAMVSLQKQFDALKKQSVTLLGDGQVFIKRSPKGDIKAVKGLITLEEANGEIAVISGKAMTTSKGFYRANSIASLSIITPEKVTLPDGEIVVNPFPVIDKASGTIRKIWCKKMAIGYGPIGNLVATSCTLLYDINMYFIQDLVKKVKENAGAGRVTIEGVLTEDEKRKGVFFRIDGEMGVWADMTHKDILKAVDTFVNKKTFGERNAQTIAERVALQKHPALAHLAYVTAEGPEKNRKSKVMVIGYVHDLSQDQLMEISKQAERGEEIRVNGEKAQVIETTATATTDEMAAEVDDEEKEKTEAVQEGLFGGDRF